MQAPTATCCYLLKVRTSGMRTLQGFLTERIKSQPDVLRTETVIVLETIKETSELAIAEPAGPRSASGDA